MSEMTATRMLRAATLAVAASGWCVCAWLLARRSARALDLPQLEERDYFSARALHRAASYSHGAQALWLTDIALTLIVLVVLTRRLPQRARSIGLGRIGTAVIVGMVVLVA